MRDIKAKDVMTLAIKMLYIPLETPESSEKALNVALVDINA